MPILQFTKTETGKIRHSCLKLLYCWWTWTTGWVHWKSFVVVVHDEDCKNKVRDKAIHKFVAGTTRLALWAVLCGLRGTGRCSNCWRLPYRTMMEKHASRQSWRNRTTHWTRSSFGPEASNSHIKGAHGHGFSHTRKRQRLRIVCCLRKAWQ